MIYHRYPHPQHPQTWTYFRTQGEMLAYARENGDKKATRGEQVDIAVDKDGVLAILNREQEQLRRAHGAMPGNDDDQAGNDDDQAGNDESQAATNSGGGHDDGKSIAKKESTVAPVLPPRSNQDVIEAILEADPASFGPMLEAAVSRLGELRHAGWHPFQTLAGQQRDNNGSLERGLGALMITAMLVREPQDSDWTKRKQGRRAKEETAAASASPMKAEEEDTEQAE